LRAGQGRKVGTPGPEGSITKLLSTQVNQQVTAYCMELLGAEGMLKPGGYSMDRPHRDGAVAIQQQFLRSRANTIEGGTTEIMRNILGERVLGLPGDVRVDKEIAWSKTLRS
jgi:alkylation response protein AidB-like acyl-CoA dehydrogenase